MAGEEVSGALGGATNGASVGASTGNPWGAVAGAVIGGIGGALSGRSKKKAAKKQQKLLQKALSMFMRGSTDAYGNTLSADSTGRWAYDLSDIGKSARSVAERELLAARNYRNRTPQEIAQDNALIQALADAQMNKIARSAVSRTGLRTGSNMSNALGNIARQSANNLRNSWINGITAGKNAIQNNANMRNLLNVGAYNAMQPLNSMQTNLQNMVRGLNGPVMQQMNAIAGVSSNPYLYGQDTADLISALGSGVGMYFNNQQNQSNYNQLIDALNKRNG